MGAGGQAGGADIADDLFAAHPIARLDLDFGKVPVAGGGPRVSDLDGVPICYVGVEMFNIEASVSWWASSALKGGG